jgi:hypothetical protein
MDASPVGIASAWSTLRAGAVQQALAVAVIKEQAKAQEAVLDMVRPAPEPAPERPSADEGRHVDIRV